VRSVVRNTRIVSGGPEGRGGLKIDLSHSSIVVSQRLQNLGHEPPKIKNGPE
jgi:hypothetical protein